MYVYFYKSQSGREPIQEFVQSLDLKSKIKIYETISYLEKFGLLLPKQYVKKIRNTKNLWELRIYHQKQYRIFFTNIKMNQILLLHIFIKKQQKTPLKEIAITTKRLKEI